MADEDTAMLSIHIDRSLHTRLKVGASMLDMSMKQFVTTLLDLDAPEISDDGASAAFREGEWLRITRHAVAASDIYDGEANA